MELELFDAERPPIVELLSPSVRLAPPRIHGRHLIPTQVRAVLDPLWHRDELPERVVRFHALDRVIVAAEGLVFDETGQRLFGPSVTQHRPDEVAAAQAAIHRHLERGSLPRHERPALLCKKRGATNYGHWLIEMLPRAFLAREQPRLARLDLCIHATAEPLRTVMRSALRSLGVETSLVVETSEEPTLFDRLVVVHGLSEHGNYISPLIIPCFSELRGGSTAPPTASGLYVVRRTHRDFLNRAWLQTLALWEGIDALDPEVFTFEAQVGLLIHRRLIAGVTGAGLANCVFARPGTRLLNFVPASMCDNFYWLLAALFDLDYEERRCEESGPQRGPAGWDRDLLIRSRHFRDLLFRHSQTDVASGGALPIPS